ncbi:unnamed protein product [Anisakis simplex]|uniref:Uncharacterized protein n=1 Tax=Anisakis simplex TaxID=6269 RepID=A0A0M3JJ05_ANISI|nr:unnamed protein product [Anisakis simplex]
MLRDRPNSTFEIRFAASARDKRPSAQKQTSSPKKKRRVEHKKIWISELQVNNLRSLITVLDEINFFNIKSTPACLVGL